MSRRRSRGRTIRRLSLLGTPAGLLLVGAACYSMHPVVPSALASAHAPDRVWLTRADRSTVVLQSPRLEGDTLLGTVDGAPQRLLLSQAAAIMTRSTATPRTIVLVMAVSGAGFAGLWYLQHRPDVGMAETCYDGSFAQNLVPCCLQQNTGPC